MEINVRLIREHESMKNGLHSMLRVARPDGIRIEA
jgi:hypothetical protein